MTQYAKINANGVLETTVANTDELAAYLLTKGFLPYITTEQPTTELDTLQSWEQEYEVTADAITQRWVVVDNASEKISMKIVELTAELTTTDYKVVKNQELAMAGGEPYYDVIALHEEREAIRIKIRELEELREPKLKAN
ncbi:MAG: hypothetical protein SNG97_06860 [Rikenellaceae bacterium]